MAAEGRSRVDPELLPLLRFFPLLDLSIDGLPALRASGPPASAPPESPDVEVVSRDVPGPARSPRVPVRIYAPRERRGLLPCVLHMHAGGYVLGSAAASAPLHVNLAGAADCMIVSVDYRLAPETRFPGAIEDCYSALDFIHGQAGALGIDPLRIGVMGESAGGGLAAALSLLARDRGDHPLAFQHLIYPMLDDRTCTRAVSPHAGEFIWTARNNEFGWSSLLGAPPGSADVSVYAAAARAEDLSGLPPAYIATGALDLFLDEDLDYAKRLVHQGVAVELHVYPGAFHAFDLSPDARVARDARGHSLAALRRSLGTDR